MLNVQCSDTVIFQLLYSVALCTVSLCFLCVCGRLGKLTEDLLRWASAVFSGGRCQQRSSRGMFFCRAGKDPSTNRLSLCSFKKTFLFFFPALHVCFFCHFQRFVFSNVTIESLLKAPFASLLLHWALSFWPHLTSFCICFSLVFLRPEWNYILFLKDPLWCKWSFGCF